MEADRSELVEADGALSFIPGRVGHPKGQFRLFGHQQDRHPRNKVEGLAITKLTNLLSVAPLLALIDSPLRDLAGVIPTFWIGEALALSDVHYLDLSVTITFALVSHLVAAALLYRLVGRRAGWQDWRLYGSPLGA